MICLKSNNSLKNYLSRIYSHSFHVLIVLFVSWATYGFFLTNPSISIDDLSGDRYYFGELAAQGRFTNTLLHHALNLVDNSPWIRDFLGLGLLVFSAFIFCAIFDRVTARENGWANTVFSCLLISSPIFTELFAYNGTCLSIGGGFLLVSLALWLTLNTIDTGKKRYLLYASLLLAVTASWNEAPVVVYLNAVFAILILKYFYSDQPFTFKKIILTGLHFAVPLIAGVFLEALIQKGIFAAFSIERSHYAKNEIELLPITFAKLYRFASSVFVKYILSALWYRPVAIFLITIFVSAILCLYYTIRKKSAIPLFLFFFLDFTTLTLSILSMDDAPYRTCQVFGFFTAFIVYFLLLRTDSLHTFLRPFFRRLAALGAALLLILQISESNYWYYYDVQRYEEEKQVMLQISDQLLDDFDISKPVVFAGSYSFSDSLKEKTFLSKDSNAYKITKKIGRLFHSEIFDETDEYALKIPQTIVKSYINHGIGAFGECNTELHKFLKYHSISYLKQGTNEMLEEAIQLSETLPQWPEKGSICDVGEFIIVNF